MAAHITPNDEVASSSLASCFFAKDDEMMKYLNYEMVEVIGLLDLFGNLVMKCKEHVGHRGCQHAD